MFIPVTHEIYAWFDEGKEYEVRAIKTRFNSRTVYRGRRVQIARGYSKISFAGTVTHVVCERSLKRIFLRIPFQKITPHARNRREALKIAHATCGRGRGYIAFKVVKRRK